MFDITALGEILIDFTPHLCRETGKQAFEQNPGGAPANVIAVIAKYGGKTAFIGKVGNDMFGRFLRDTLCENGIDCTCLAEDDTHNTTLAFVSLNEEGDREFSFYRNYGADLCLTKEDVDDKIIADSKIFHFGTLSLTQEPARSATDYAINTAKRNGCIVTFDPNYRAPLWKSAGEAAEVIKKYCGCADIIKMSKEEATLAAGTEEPCAAGEYILSRGAKLVLVTDGANGVRYFSEKGRGLIPAIEVKAVDTTGAGDIFFGTFLYEMLKLDKPVALLEVREIRSCIKRAVIMSGLSTLKHGAIPSIPDYAVLKDYMTEHEEE